MFLGYIKKYIYWSHWLYCCQTKLISFLSFVFLLQRSWFQSVQLPDFLHVYANSRPKTKKFCHMPLVCTEFHRQVQRGETSNKTEGYIEVIFLLSPNHWAFDEVQLIIYIFMEQMVPLRPASLEPLRAKAFGFFGLSGSKTIRSFNDSWQMPFSPSMLTCRRATASSPRTWCCRAACCWRTEGREAEECAEWRCPPGFSCYKPSFSCLWGEISTAGSEGVQPNVVRSWGPTL